MISVFGRVGERMVDVFVPRISADAAVTSAACTYPNCGKCVNHRQYFRACCKGKCSPCRAYHGC